MSKQIKVKYGPNAPTLLLTCKQGAWTEVDRVELERLFGEERVTWYRDRKQMIVISDNRKIAATLRDAEFSKIISRSEKSGHGDGLITGTFKDICRDINFEPFFAHWPKARAPAPRKQTGTLDGYR